jgi:hypothetical protein
VSRIAGSHSPRGWRGRGVRVSRWGGARPPKGLYLTRATLLSRATGYPLRSPSGPRHPPGSDQSRAAGLRPRRVHLPLQPAPLASAGCSSTASLRARSHPIPGPTRNCSAIGRLTRPCGNRGGAERIPSSAQSGEVDGQGELRVSSPKRGSMATQQGRRSVRYCSVRDWQAARHAETRLLVLRSSRLVQAVANSIIAAAR